MTDRILIIEDDRALAEAFVLQIERAGFLPVHAAGLADGVAQLKQAQSWVAIILDLGLPDGDGLSLLRNNAELLDHVPVIVVTADGSINRAIEAMRLGAFDFLVKPIAFARLANAIDGAQKARQNLAQDSLEKCKSKTSSGSKDGFMGFIGASPPMQKLYHQIARVAPSRAGVMICGESGTGKELCAEALHQASPRAPHPFIAINCGAIPEKLIESQLFGHVKGAFTGAIADHMGAAQLAHKGTLFLDEICELDLHLQVKLLRFIQNGWVHRVGAAHPQQVDVRIICATNRDPVAEVKAGRLREDLYYRLAVIPMAMPPLRDRGDDIIILANAFLQRFAKEEGRIFDPLCPAQSAALLAHGWPGNVRELQNIMRRAVVIEDGPLLTQPLVAPVVQVITNANRAIFAESLPAAEPRIADVAFENQDLTLDEIERQAIDRAIARANGSLSIAARNLGISPSTLYRKRERWVTPSANSL
jgi:two-component system, repressor protein LuxO